MKVKSAELKAKLSLYLRKLRETGEPIEVLLRDEPVAYLTPIESGAALRSTENAAELRKLKSAFADVGLTMADSCARVGALPKLTPVIAGDGSKDIVTVESMRTGKDW